MGGEDAKDGDAALDPRGLIGEAYAIEGIAAPDCRAIFLDWVLGLPAERDAAAAAADLLERWGAARPHHPMTAVLREAVAGPSRPPRRRRRRRS